MLLNIFNSYNNKKIYGYCLNFCIFNFLILSFTYWWYFTFQKCSILNNVVYNIDFFEISAGILKTKIDYSFNLYFYYFSILLILSSILFLLPFILSKKKFTIEKNTAYECGFEPFFVQESSIEVHFLIVALLFLIFDLEVIFLVPLSLFLTSNGSFGVVILFLYVLTIVLMLILEWLSGALTWPIWYTF